MNRFDGEVIYEEDEPKENGETLSEANSPIQIDMKFKNDIPNPTITSKSITFNRT